MYSEASFTESLLKALSVCQSTQRLCRACLSTERRAHEVDQPETNPTVRVDSKLVGPDSYPRA